MLMPVSLINIRKRIDFLKISKEGQKKFTKGFILQKVKRNNYKDKFLDKNFARIGLTVTKRVGTAVVRNKVKRRLRSLSKEILTIMGKKNYDYVIIANKKAILMNYNELKKDLIEAIK